MTKTVAFSCHTNAKTTNGLHLRPQATLPSGNCHAMELNRRLQECWKNAVRPVTTVIRVYLLYVSDYRT